MSARTAADGHDARTDLGRLVAVATAAAAAPSLDEIVAAVAAQTAAVLGVSWVAIARWDGHAGTAPTLASAPAHMSDDLHVGADLARALAGGDAVGAGASGAVARDLRAALGSGGGIAPIFRGGRPWGVLAASSAGDPLDGADLDLLAGAASVLAGAIDRGEHVDRLERYAFEDPLTGLANRRALDDRLAVAVSTAAPGRPVTLMMCDVDGFKELNDAAGHDAGDRVLQRLARLLENATASHAGALVARVGGDEFCIVLDGEGLQSAELVARTTAAAVATDSAAEVTLAWGAAATEEAIAPTELYRRADAAQYTAKRLGHGRICLDRADAAPAPSMVPLRRRRGTTAWMPGAAVIAEAMAILEALPPDAGAVDRLEAAVAGLARSIDAAGWSISRVDRSGSFVRTVRGYESRLDAGSGARVVDVASEEPYRLEHFPSTARAIADGGGFHVRTGDAEGDPAERAVLEDLGYREVIAAAASDGLGSYLVEVYGDSDTPTLEPALAALRLVAVHAAAATGRRPGDDELSIALERFETAFEQAPDGMALLTPAGRILQINAAGCRMLGRSREELLALDSQALTHPDDLQAGQSLVESAIAGDREDYDIEKRFLRRDGSVVWTAVHARLVRDAAGQPSYFVSRVEDISDRKRAEAEVARRIADLRALGIDAPEHAVVPDDEARQTDVLVARVLDISRHQIGVPVACVTRATADGISIRSLAGDGEPFGAVAGTLAPPDSAICARMLAGRIGHVVTDTTAVPELAAIPGLTDTVGAYIGVPITLADGDVYGTLCCFDAVPRPDVGSREERLLADLADVVAAQLDHDRRRVEEGRARSGLTGVYALVAALEARDRYTGSHSRTVVALARRVAQRLGFDGDEIDEIAQVALLHDVGKVAIPDAVLQKPGALTTAEWELMREHPGVGARVVGSIPELAHLAAAIRAEHERWDGRGYPDGLAGSSIPVAARIALACDAYDSMTSDRPYRPGRTSEEARAELREHAGTQFDPAVVAALEAVLDDWPDDTSLGADPAAVAPAA